MSNPSPITIMIHDLNPWGGQDRSMLEIAWQLNKKFPLEIHSFSLEGYQDWPDMKHIPYQASIKKPIIFKYLSYQLSTWQNLRVRKPTWVQSTGTASLVSNVIQVQFIHHSWQKIAAKMPPDKQHSLNPLRRVYNKALNQYKLGMEKALYTPEKQYIAISHSIKKELMEHFCIPSENITIIYHGVDHEHFHPARDTAASREGRNKTRALLDIKDDEYILLHVGALNARKGLFQSFEVLAFLKENGFSNVRLLAVGQGDRKILERLSAQHNIADQIILAPHSKDIRNYYWAADCFFFPTFYEPFGLVILEAMACGLPVVASSRAGGSELIKHNENGLLFDPFASQQEIANHLLPLFREPSTGKRLGEAARKKALEHSWQRVGKEYQNFYSRLQENTQKS